MGGFENPIFLGLIILALPALYFGLKSDEKFKTVVGTTKIFYNISFDISGCITVYTGRPKHNGKSPKIVLFTDESTLNRVVGQTRI